MAQWKSLGSNQGYARDVRNANTFKDGLNMALSPFFVSENSLIDGFGWDFESFPALQVRLGRTAFGTAGSGVTRLLTNFGNTHLVRAVGSDLQYNSSGSNWTIMAGSFSDKDWDSANFDINGPALILSNGTDTPRYWNGSTLTTNSAMPKGKYVAADNRRVYTAGISGELDSVYYCAFQDALDWTTVENSGIVQFYTANGGAITALHAFEGQIYAFKKDAFCLIFHTGDSRVTHRLVEASNDIGCVSYKTVVELGPYLFWLGFNQVYICSGGSAQAIGEGVKTFLETINYAAAENACAWSDGTRYYLCIPTGNSTQPDTCLVYDYQFKKWLPYSNDIGGMRFGAILNNVPYGGFNSGQTYRMNNGVTDAGVAIPWEVASRPFDDGIKEAEKELYAMHLLGLFPSGTAMNVEVSTTEPGGTSYPISYDPSTSSDYTQSKNMIVPLDTVPLCNYYSYKLSGTGPATIQEIQRYSRLHPVQI